MTSLSSDGRHLAYNFRREKAEHSDIAVVAVDDPTAPLDRFPNTSSNEASPQISPDERFLAYMSDESEDWEVYLTRFPSGEGREVVSLDGGIFPRWSRDGTELFFVSNRTLMSVEIKPGNAEMPLQEIIGEPTAIFSGREKGIHFSQGRARTYDVASGDRFVVVQAQSDESIEGRRPVIVVDQTWIAKIPN